MRVLKDRFVEEEDLEDFKDLFDAVIIYYSQEPQEVERLANLSVEDYTQFRNLN